MGKVDNTIREEFFNLHTKKDQDGIPRIITHPHNLFEWFKDRIRLD